MLRNLEFINAKYFTPQESLYGAASVSGTSVCCAVSGSCIHTIQQQPCAFALRARLEGRFTTMVRLILSIAGMSIDGFRVVLLGGRLGLSRDLTALGVPEIVGGWGGKFDAVGERLSGLFMEYVF